MEPINWIAVILAANLAVALGIVWHGALFRTGRPFLEGPGGAAKSYGSTILVMLLGAGMLGHNFARIGAETLHAKPWLYFMQSGGIAVFFIIPVLWLAYLRQGVEPRFRAVDCGYWLMAYLVMGATFWALD